jgi:hypothetical protein
MKLVDLADYSSIIAKQEMKMEDWFSFTAEVETVSSRQRNQNVDVM